MSDEGVTWLVNRRTAKQVGPYLEVPNGLLADLVEDDADWTAMGLSEFHAWAKAGGSRP